MVNWVLFNTPVNYLKMLEIMTRAHSNVANQLSDETIFLLEHENVITRGVSAKDHDLLTPSIPVIPTNRGGKFTYHGPGQLICYPILNLKHRGIDVRQFVRLIEKWIIQTLGQFGINSYLKDGMIGVWVMDGDQEKKIAAIGLKIQKFVSMHGFAINIKPNMRYFEQIIPCGINNYGVISMAKLDSTPTQLQLYRALQTQFDTLFL